MNNIKGFENFNEELLDKFFSKNTISKEDVEKTGKVTKETMAHPDYSATIRFALSNINNSPVNNRDEVIEKLVTWINDITTEFPNINNGTMVVAFNKHFDKI